MASCQWTSSVLDPHSFSHERTHIHRFTPYRKENILFPFRLMIYWGATSLYSSKLLCSRYAALSQLLCVRLHICTFLPKDAHSAIDHRLLCHISPHIRSEGCSLGQLLFLRLFMQCLPFPRTLLHFWVSLLLSWMVSNSEAQRGEHYKTSYDVTHLFIANQICFLMFSTVILMRSITQQWHFVLKTALVFAILVMVLIYIIIYFVLL